MTNWFFEGVRKQAVLLLGRDGATEAGALNPLPVANSGDVYVPAVASFTRPANTTAYTANSGSAAGDLIANDTTAGSVAPLSFAVPSIIDGDDATGAITVVELQLSSPHAATVRCHLFVTTAPTVTNGDNGALAVSNFLLQQYLGPVDVVIAPGPAGGSVGRTECYVPYTKADAELISLLLEDFATAITPTSAEVISARIVAERLS